MDFATVARTQLEQLLKGAGGPEASRHETEAVVQVFLFGFVRSGCENPKSMMGPISDALLEHLVKNLGAVSSIPNLAKVGQFFIMEWCWRNGHLVEDWRWEWKDKNSGDLKFLPRVPLSMIPIPKPDNTRTGS